MTYTAYQIIDRKKNGKKLSSGELNWFISGLISGEVQDYQASALLMAISIKGMDTAETAALTEVMLKSGRVLKFSGNNVVDKHSTGGVGDKASFILGPLAAACGVKVPMIAGRGLGFTGGTIDKIESIPGFQTKMNLDEFAAQLEKTGFVLIGQTEEIAPADKILYAIRDVTATIDSIPLITASIMSKKLAEGANGIVMDIKVGSGAFMGDLKIASALAKSIIQTAKRFKKNAVALLTDMNQPLGLAVGNSLEIIESIETLQGKGPKDLTDLSVELAAHMVFIGKKAKSLALARKMVLEKLHDGSALEKFKELVVEQGGDIKVINNLTKLPLAKTITIVKAKKKGFISHMQNADIGYALTDLGGGRKTKNVPIDLGVGFIFHKKIGDAVKKDEALLSIYHHDHQRDFVESLSKKFQNEIIEIKATKVKKSKLIYKIIK